MAKSPVGASKDGRAYNNILWGVRIQIAICLSLMHAVTYAQTSYSPLESPPTESLEGTIKVIGTDLVVEDVHRDSWLPTAPDTLPVMQFDVVAIGNSVVPATRSLQISTHYLFDYIISPGKAWFEGGENWASLPFTLIHRWVNCTHNGVLKFRYSDSQVDQASIIVQQETCHFHKFNMEGSVHVDYSLKTVPDGDAVRQNYSLEVSSRLPTATFDDFESKYGIDAAAFLSGLPQDDDLTVAGILFEGVHYRTDCRTRDGPYPYCDHMLLTSFSTSKSVYPPLVLMYLANERGDGVFNEYASSYLPETDLSPGNWDEVTINHLVDMTSGNFEVDSPLADTAPGDFYALSDSSSKLKEALSWPNGARAGTRFVYQTADTYILVTVLDRYLHLHGLGYSDSFEFLVDKVYRKLNLSPEVMYSRRTNDAEQVNTGRALGGFGLWWDTDSIAKLAEFMLVDEGRVGDEQLLHSETLSATLQSSSQDRGADTRVLGQRYNNGMWAFPAHEYISELDSCEAWVPHMSGLSGIRVFLMPNGLVFYYFNDIQQFPLLAPIVASNQVEPLCSQSTEDEH